MGTRGLDINKREKKLKLAQHALGYNAPFDRDAVATITECLGVVRKLWRMTPIICFFLLIFLPLFSPTGLKYAVGCWQVVKYE